MSPKLKGQLLKAVKRTTLSKWYDLKLFLGLKWIDIRYGVEEWFCLKTWKWRFKHTKRLKLYSLAYNRPQAGWDDVEVSDQWGLWLPIGFGVVSKANWDFDQEINRKAGLPEDKWEDFIDGDWPTYYYKDEFLLHNHYFDAARKNFKKRMGDAAYDKEIELTLFVQSQKSLDDETLQWAQWAADGSKPLKVEFTDQAKEDFTRLLGEEDAKDLFKQFEEKQSDEDSNKQ